MRPHHPKSIIILFIVIIVGAAVIYLSVHLFSLKGRQIKSTSDDLQYNYDLTSRLKEVDRTFLLEQGLANPAKDLVTDLMKHNELIPCKGTHGGTPGFYDPAGVTIVSKNRVKASYEDGHEAGTIELSFSVTHGKIAWKILHAECGS